MNTEALHISQTNIITDTIDEDKIKFEPCDLVEHGIRIAYPII
jgi:hypothetical protein